MTKTEKFRLWLFWHLRHWGFRRLAGWVDPFPIPPQPLLAPQAVTRKALAILHKKLAEQNETKV